MQSLNVMCLLNNTVGVLFLNPSNGKRNNNFRSTVSLKNVDIHEIKV